MRENLRVGVRSEDRLLATKTVSVPHGPCCGASLRQPKLRRLIHLGPLLVPLGDEKEVGPFGEHLRILASGAGKHVEQVICAIRDFQHRHPS